MGVPNVFGSATTSIPLSQLDQNFNTGLTIGNTTVGLGNTVTTLGNVTLTNVNIASGTNNVTIGNTTVSLGNTATTVGNLTLTNTTISSTATALPYASLPTGSVLQVVNSKYSTEVQSSTTTYVDTGLTATITPKFSTSKILILISQNGLQKSNSNTSIEIQLLRNGSVISLLENGAGYNAGTGANYIGGISANYLDSPATTSALTYKTQTCSAGNTAIISVQVNSATSTITLMEISA